MRTVKRIYIYLVCIISLEVVLWGMIGLMRSIFSGHSLGGDVTRLAAALSLILVGVPFFLGHWLWAQRDAARDPDERASGVRAVFLYGVLLGTLVPGVQNTLAFINRSLLPAFHSSRSLALFGAQQSLSDNLIALVMNLLIAAYFVFVLRGDWKVVAPRDAFVVVRRIYRYLWVIYGLAMLVGGVQQLLYFVLQWASRTALSNAPTVYDLRAVAANGLALALVGTPAWVAAWLTVQKSLAEAEERASLLRLGILYFLSLAGVTTVLTAGGIVVDVLLRLLLGEANTLAGVLLDMRGPLSIGVPIGGVWAYYGYWLSRTMKEVPDAPRRAGMRRLYYYILSAVGLAASFIGLNMLLNFMVDILTRSSGWQHTLRLQLAAALATLAAGFPLWVLTWLPMESEALAVGDAGDHARRSLNRKIYLYLALFAGVIGVMASAGVLVYNLLQALLGRPPDRLMELVLDSLRNLLLFVILGVYHGLVLARDGRQAASALTQKHAAFPVLVFDPGDGAFGAAVQAAIRKHTPGMPVNVQPAGQAIPKETAPRAIVLPGDLALNPPAALRKWLEKYGGNRIVVPREAPGWVWTGGLKESMALAQAAQAVGQLAEGQEVRLAAGGGGGAGALVALYILASICGLQVLIFLISLGMSVFMD